jgi:hypothetical protein
MVKVPVEERNIVRVYELPNIKQDTIYVNTLVWIAKSFKSSRSVIEYKDKENGIIIGNGNIKYWQGILLSTLYFQIKINIKDYKIRITYDNLQSESLDIKKYVKTQKQINVIKPNVEKINISLINSIKKEDDF